MLMIAAVTGTPARAAEAPHCAEEPGLPGLLAATLDETPALMGSSPLFVLLFYWTFRRMDRAMFESAELDGATLFQAWWHIGLPLARPALMAVGMLSFLYYWNDFINPLLYLRSQPLFTLPVGLLQLQEMDKTNWPLLMAASAVMTVPAVIVFSVLQRALLWWDGEG